MTVYPSANAIYGLTHIDWDLVKVAQDVAPDLVSERPNSPAPESQIDRHALLRRHKLEIAVRLQERLDDVFCDMPHDRDTDSVPTDVIGVVVALGQHVIVA